MQVIKALVVVGLLNLSFSLSAHDKLVSNWGFSKRGSITNTHQVSYDLAYFSKLFCRKDLWWQGRSGRPQSMIDILTSTPETNEEDALRLLKKKKISALLEWEQIKSLQNQLAPYLKTPLETAISKLQQSPQQIKKLKEMALSLGYKMGTDTKDNAKELLSISHNSSPWGLGASLDLRESEVISLLGQIAEAIEAFQAKADRSKSKTEQNSLAEIKKFKKIKSILGTPLYKGAGEKIVYFYNGQARDICHEDTLLPSILERVLKSRQLKLSKEECEEIKRHYRYGAVDFALMIAKYLKGYDRESKEVLDNAEKLSIPITPVNQSLADTLKEHYHSRIQDMTKELKEVLDPESGNYETNEETRKLIQENYEASIAGYQSEIQGIEEGFIPATTNSSEEVRNTLVGHLSAGKVVQGYETVLENGEIVIYPALRITSDSNGTGSIDKKSQSIRMSSQPVLKISKDNARKKEWDALEAFYKNAPVSHQALISNDSQIEGKVFTGNLSDLITHGFDCP